jgi:hypothetical protein
MEPITRRRVITGAIKGLGAYCLSGGYMTWQSALAEKRNPPLTTKPQNSEDHFFLQVMIPGGFDPLYMFDSRPMELSQKGLQVNHNTEDHQIWQGRNGVSTLATSTTRDLKAYQDYFSVINGVLMATNFDGHDQNMNFFLTGNAFGGESFVPHLNFQEKNPLDGLVSGFLLAELQNSGKMVPLSPDSASRLLPKVNEHLASLNSGGPEIAHAMRRMFSLGKGGGRFSLGSLRMGEAFSKSSELAQSMAGALINPMQGPQVPPEDQFLQLMSGFFRSRIVKSAVLSLNLPQAVDTHDATSAKASVTLAKSVSQKLKTIIKGLIETEFRDGQSMMDVTTFVIGSEFGRSMRQEGVALEASGTDHNPLNSSLIIGGKGVRHGWVIGGSDFIASDEVLSGAHLQLDPSRTRTMGHPLDFSTLRKREDKPSSYKEEDYLGIASVVNTIYRIFGFPQERYRSLGRNLPPAPALLPLIS